jgi:hypothetical protein
MNLTSIFLRLIRPSVVLLCWMSLAVIATSMAGSSAARAQGFFATVSDLPLMASMTERTDEALFYDKPGGRIVEVVAEGTASASATKAFYADTLPQLGWAVAGTGFERDGERLKILYEQSGETLIVRISINPK